MARDCGLGSAANLRLHFRRALGATTPLQGWRVPYPDRLRRRPLALLCAWAALVLVAPALAAPALADSSDPPRRAHDRTQAALDRIVAQGTPGVIAQVRDGHGVW
ncbi:hypothetical protein AB4Z54_62430, partial [Streptomyces sp. MCAF7]